MKLFIVGLILLLTTGCASMKFAEQSPMLELVVRASAGRVLTENPSWVQPTADVTEAAILVVKTGVLTQLQNLDTYVLAQLPSSLTPEEHALAVVLVGSLKNAIIADLDRRGIQEPEDIKVRVVQVLSWINQTAAYRVE